MTLEEYIQLPEDERRQAFATFTKEEGEKMISSLLAICRNPTLLERFNELYNPN